MSDTPLNEDKFVLVHLGHFYGPLTEEQLKKALHGLIDELQGAEVTWSRLAEVKW